MNEDRVRSKIVDGPQHASVPTDVEVSAYRMSSPRHARELRLERRDDEHAVLPPLLTGDRLDHTHQATADAGHRKVYDPT